MTRPTGNSDDDLAAPVLSDFSGPTFSLPGGAEEALGAAAAVADAGDAAPDADADVYRVEKVAAAQAGDVRRAAALLAAGALVTEIVPELQRGDPTAAETAWREAFDADPGLLVALWGLGRSLRARGAWDDLAAAIMRRIAALGPDDHAQRADLWVERGRLREDRSGDDEGAAASYRAALGEVPEHAPALVALLLLGWRTADAALVAEALGGLLARSGSAAVPAHLRAALAASLARLEREKLAGAGQDVAVRSFARTRQLLGEVHGDAARPLVDELGALARITTDPRQRAEMLGELATALEPGAAAVAAALLRERAALCQGPLGDRAEALRSLKRARALAPQSPLVLVALADLLAGTVPASGAARARDNDRHGEGDTAGSAADELGRLLGEVAPGERALEPGAEQELALRTVTALAREGRAQQGIELLARHPELPSDRLDLIALEMALQAMAGSLDGLASSFERWGAALAPTSPETARVQVMAATLRARAGGEEAGPRAEALLRRALEHVPGYRPAVDALERLLVAGGRDADLAALWRNEHVRGERARAEPPAQAAPQIEDGPAHRRRVLEELVAIHRDALDNPAAALRFADELGTLDPADVRVQVRRRDLELALAARGAAPAAADEARTLRALADGALSSSSSSSSSSGKPAASGPRAALLTEAALALAAAGDLEQASALLREALPADRSGRAAAALERLGSTPADRARVVEGEIDSYGNPGRVPKPSRDGLGRASSSSPDATA
jgi:hypothetical protein